MAVAMLRPALVRRGAMDHDMRQLDASDLYRWGVGIGPLLTIREGLSVSEIYSIVSTGSAAVSNLLDSSMQLNLSSPVGHVLNGLLVAYEKIIKLEINNKPAPISAELLEIRKKAIEFETLLRAELAKSDTYHVAERKGYVVRCLIESGTDLFPADLAIKAPDAIRDVKQATKCLAFELFTAAAFHLHRANESVLHVYFDAVAGKIQRPTSGNMGDYLNLLSNNELGTPELRAVLRQIKDLHRNPIAHPDQSIDDIEEVDALLGAVKSAMFHMLKAI